MDDITKKEILGHLIKSEREKQGLTQDKLSSLIEIDPRNFSKIEKGKSFPSFSTFCKIIEVLKIEPNYLLSFISFEKASTNPLDLELLAIIKGMSDEVKTKIKEIALLINK